MEPRRPSLSAARDASGRGRLQHPGLGHLHQVPAQQHPHTPPVLLHTPTLASNSSVLGVASVFTLCHQNLPCCWVGGLESPQGVQLPTLQPQPLHLEPCLSRKYPLTLCYHPARPRGLASWECLETSCHSRGGCHLPLSPPRDDDQQELDASNALAWLLLLCSYAPTSNTECCSMEL